MVLFCGESICVREKPFPGTFNQLAPSSLIHNCLLRDSLPRRSCIHNHYLLMFRFMAFIMMSTIGDSILSLRLVSRQLIQGLSSLSLRFCACLSNLSCSPAFHPNLPLGHSAAFRFHVKLQAPQDGTRAECCGCVHTISKQVVRVFCFLIGRTQPQHSSRVPSCGAYSSL